MITDNHLKSFVPTNSLARTNPTRLQEATGWFGGNDNNVGDHRAPAEAFTTSQ